MNGVVTPSEMAALAEVGAAALGVPVRKWGLLLEHRHRFIPGLQTTEVGQVPSARGRVSSPGGGSGVEGSV